MEQPPMTTGAAPGSSNGPVETTTLPAEVVQCLENARFLHLATCTDNKPHVSLMNYTYLPSSPYSSSPAIVMTTNPGSKKYENVVENRDVSLLVHDWVSHRPPTSTRRMSGGNGSPGPDPHRTGNPSSLATLLHNLNTSSISSISATINGDARIVERGTEEEKWFREKHLENNTFEGDDGVFGGEGGRLSGGGGGGGAAAGAGGGSGSGSGTGGGSGGGGENEPGRCFVEGEEVRVILVGIRDVRVSDWKGGVRDWVVRPSETAHGGVNGC